MTSTTTDELEKIRVESRDYQEEILGEITEAFRGGLSSLVVDSPTGSGKTFMGLASARYLVNELLPSITGVSSDRIGVAWVAMRSNLLTATNKVNQQYYYGDGAPEGSDYRFCPNLNTVSMFSRDSKFMQERYDLRIAIIDEGHHDTTDSMARVYNDINPTYCIGLTATPFRTDQNRLGFQKVIKNAGYRSLIDRGYLASFNFWSIPNSWTPVEVTGTYIESPGAWGSSVMFFLTRDECDEADRLLRAAGIRSTVVHGGSDREQQIQDLEDGKLDVIISMAILAEGFDYPALASVFVRDSMSKGLTIQMAGRVLRNYRLPDGTAKVANIVQSAAAQYPFTRFARARNQYVKPHGRWLSIAPNDNVEKHVEYSLRHLSSSVIKDKATIDRLSKIANAKKKKTWSPPKEETE